MASPKKRSRGCLRRALSLGAYVLFLIAAVGALLEVGVRVAMPQPDMPRWYRESERYGYALKPGFRQRYRFANTDFVMDVSTNALGLRDEPLAPLPEGGVTALCIGDSFTFGFGVNIEDRFDTILEECLDDSLPARVINAGVPGWGTVQATAFARDHFEAFQPDVIVLTFCDNDPLDDARWLAGETVFREGGLVSFPGKRWLRNRSHLYRLLLERSKILRHRLVRRGGEAPAEAKAAADAEPGAADAAPAISGSEWDRSLGVLRDFYADLQAFNPDGLLLIQATTAGDPDVARRLRQFAHADGVHYVDLETAAAGLSESEIILSFDRHWSPLMHRRVGLLLCETLTGLLPAD